MAHESSGRVIPFQNTDARGRSLPRHCSKSLRRSIDTDFFRSRDAAIGQFRCPTDHPLFNETGPITECVVVFPRTSVWIEHDGQRRFVADPTVVTIYNRDQRYMRFPISQDGDRCDWFAVSDDVAREIAARFDPSAADTHRPFTATSAPSSPELYLRQRLATSRAQRGELDSLAGEEVAMEIVSAVLSRAHMARPAPASRQPRAARRRGELVAAARAEVAATFTRNRSVREIADAVGATPFHLCRVFRAHTGLSLVEFRNELRARRALELMGPGSRDCESLSAVAYDVGFASHSHLVAAMRRHYGAPPSRIRDSLRPRR
jgi:AraC family transcriptional regulator